MKPFIVKIIISITLLYILLYSFFVYISILEYKDMDFNKNGWIELSETFTAIDIGENHLDNNCTEYYFLKDGMPFLTKCK